MEFSFEKLVSLITVDVVKELVKQGVTVNTLSGKTSPNSSVTGFRNKCQRIDMSKYKTPILTENHIRRLHELTGLVQIPKGTVITPKAKELIRERQISLELE